MKFAYHGSWLRLIVEMFPGFASMRRHRIFLPPMAARQGRLLRSRIARKLRHAEPEILK